MPEGEAPSETLAGMIAPTRTALVVVDVQVDFASPEGLIGRYGGDMSTVEPAIDRIEALIAAARAVGVTVAMIRVVTRPETDGAALKAFYARRGMAGGHGICRAEGGGADYYRVAPVAGDIEIRKLMFNAFHGTDLDAQLRTRGVDTLVVTGISTDCCVDQTVRDAFHRDFHVFVVSDACAAYEPSLHHGTLDVLSKNCALLVDSAAVEHAWAA